jgi:hypothetical protein
MLYIDVCSSSRKTITLRPERVATLETNASDVEPGEAAAPSFPAFPMNVATVTRASFPSSLALKSDA